MHKYTHLNTESNEVQNPQQLKWMVWEGTHLEIGKFLPKSQSQSDPSMTWAAPFLSLSLSHVTWAAPFTPMSPFILNY